MAVQSEALVLAIDNLTKEISKLTESHNELCKEVHTIHQANKEISSKCEELEKKLKKLELDNTFLRSQVNANNIVLYNVPEKEASNVELNVYVMEMFNKLNLPIPEFAVADAFRLGKKSEKSVRPILIKFLGAKWIKIMFSKIDDFKSINVIISRDYSKEERMARRELKQKVQDLVHRKIDATIKNNKICINGSEVQLEFVDNILKENKKRQVKRTLDQQSNDSTPDSNKEKKPRRRPNKQIQELKTNRQLLDFFNSPSTKPHDKENNEVSVSLSEQ